MFPHPFWDLRHVLQAIRTAKPMHPDCFDYLSNLRLQTADVFIQDLCSYLQVNCGMLGWTGTVEAIVQHHLFKSENSPPWATKLCKMGLLVPSAWTHHFFQLPQAWLKSTLLQPSSTDMLNQGGHFCLSCGLMEMFPQQHWSPWMHDSPILQTRVEKGCNLSK